MCVALTSAMDWFGLMAVAVDNRCPGWRLIWAKGRRWAGMFRAVLIGRASSTIGLLEQKRQLRVYLFL